MTHFKWSQTEPEIRRAFDEKALSDLEAILATPKDFSSLPFPKEDFLEDQKRKAIFWCHQQAALLPANAYVWRVDESRNVLKSLDITANYLFKTFFPDLVQNEKE